MGADNPFANMGGANPFGNMGSGGNPLADALKTLT